MLLHLVHHPASVPHRSDSQEARLLYSLITEYVKIKVGYEFGDHLLKYSSILTGKRIDKTKLQDLLLALGFLLPESCAATIFSSFGIENGKALDTQSFCRALEEGDAEDPNLRRMRAAKVAEYTGKSCPIAEEILKAYDDTMVEAVKAAFDIFDKNGTNRIAAVELERMLNSLGHFPSNDELITLMLKIDRKATGVFDFNDFVTHAVPYIRSTYENASKISLERYKVAFDALDVNGDGTLHPSEFRHIIASSVAQVNDRELDELMAYLDIDKDGAVNWNEFQRLHRLTSDDEALGALSIGLRRVVRKIQFAFLPDPFKSIGMFSGLPINYRLSVLSSLGKSHSLDEIVCMTNFHGTVRSADSNIAFEFEIVRCVGVPSEDDSRRADVVSRYAKFSLCYTDKPPTAEEPGSPPIFLGNMTKLHATIHASYMDKWVFANKDELDPDVSCFAMCSTEDVSQEFMNTVRSLHQSPSLSKVYIFIELIIAIKVKPAAGSRGRSSIEGGDVDGQNDTSAGLEGGSLPELKSAGDIEVDKPNIVEMCVGWAMIPVETVLRGSSHKVEIPMNGGTPFAVVSIKQSDVALRQGVWQSLKRAAGFGVKSVLTVLIRKKDFTGAGIASLYQLLPSNIVIPSSSTTMVAVYRKLLKEAQLILLSSAAGGFQPSTDPIFSNFPKFLADPAASRVMLYLWSKEAPEDLTRYAGFKILREEAVDPRSLQIFRDIVLRVYHAFNSPESQPSRLHPIETVDDINRRERIMRGIVGLHVESQTGSALGGTLARSFSVGLGALSSSISKPGGQSQELGKGTLKTLGELEKLPPTESSEHTYTPFHTRELMWKSTSNLFSQKNSG